MFESLKRFDNEDLCNVWKIIIRYKLLNNNIVKYVLINSLREGKSSFDLLYLISYFF